MIKNRLGPPLKSIDYDIYFDSGIDDYGGWLNVLKDNKLVSQAGAWYTYVDVETGEEIKFQSKDFEEKILENPELKEQIYNRICSAVILKYKPGEDGGIDDIVIDEEVINSEG